MTAVGLTAIASVTALAGPTSAAAVHRWGVVPQRTPATAAPHATYSLTRSLAPLTASASDNTLSYGGGIGGGVVAGAPRVYLVFWGAQWGATFKSSVQGKGAYTAFRGDHSGIAPLLQAFFAGLGTRGEGWSSVMTQYCQSSATTTVPLGATSCPAGAAFVPAPNGGVLAGVWEDARANAPAAASASDLAAEAEKAAGHFGNTTAAANQNAVYVVLSPSGTHPDHFGKDGGYCAWHDDSADTQGGIVAAQPNGPVAFVNMPYITEAGIAASCGAGAVNSPGTTDGVTLIAGHEYAEWLTDPFPGGGWFNTLPGPQQGSEAADECAWLTAGAGAMSDLSLATGSFPVQSIWSNAAGTCAQAEIKIAALPSTASSALGASIAPVGVVARDVAPGQTVTYAAAGLPAGLAIDPVSGRITGTATAPVGVYRVVVWATDTSGAQTQTTISWTVTGDVLLARPHNQSSARHKRVRLRIGARDALPNRTLWFSAAGLPPGLRINPRTGLITGSARSSGRSYTVRIVVSDSAGALGRTAFIWRVR